jgi:hypothetical protein
VISQTTNVSDFIGVNSYFCKVSDFIAISVQQHLLSSRQIGLHPETFANIAWNVRTKTDIV